MTKPTHIRQVDGVSRGPLIDSIRPYPDQIRYSLTRMNGTSKWAYSLWRVPEGADLLEDIPFSDEYLQCAGSAEAMTIEVRIVNDGGTGHQYVVGRPAESVLGAPTVVIPRDNGKHSDTVYPHEVFTADEAADIFYAYFLTDQVPEQYQLRELDLTWPPAKPTLTFSDNKDNEEPWFAHGATPALDAFLEFVSGHHGEDNMVFSIEREGADEGVTLMLDYGLIGRIKGVENPLIEYRLVTDGDYRSLADTFIRGGFDALDPCGPWLPDVESVLRARLEFEKTEERNPESSGQRNLEDANDLSEAIVVYLKNYPGSNAEQFEARFPGDAARDAVREMLTETLRLEPDWEGKTLSEVSRDVREMMHDRYPELSAPALRCLGNYFSYQMK